MVEHHGSQCGFCTPGFVMALYALWMENADPSEEEIETALQGNLCRCTGYAPIVRAAQAATRGGSPAADHLTRERDTIVARLQALRDGARVEVERDGARAILPADVDDLAEVLVAHPEATIVAGATDVGLWVTKFLRPIAPAIFLGHLDALRAIEIGPEAVRIGAGASYSDCEPMLAEVFPHLGDYWRRIGGWQVRNAGTVGGNIANGSPIGDTPPVLIALGATVTLRHGTRRRELPLEEFFIAYGKQDRMPGEFVEAVTVPRIAPGSLHAAYKISKRRDEDISSVAAGFNLTVERGKITGARIAFGGMAATPKRAAHAEAALVGRAWCEASLVTAAAELERDFTPLTDWRASAEYRMTVARNLFRRFHLDHAGPAADAAAGDGLRRTTMKQDVTTSRRSALRPDPRLRRSSM
jgi:xanthine dehydrogenase small subunit